jgi:stage IV sporulation protein FB
MNVAEPRRTRFDLRWKLLGTPFRATPLFWAAVAVLGIRYYADPEAGSFGYFVFWMVAAVSAVLLHDLGQILVGRFFAMRGDVVLYGLGSLTMGADTLSRRWQRVVVLLSGSLIQFVFVAVIWGLTWAPYPALLGSAPLRYSIGNGTAILLRAHFYWGLLNLLPIWPLDGGRIACEIGDGLFGRRGIWAALGLSLVTCAAVAIFVTLQLSVRLDFRFDPRYLLYLEEFTVLLLFCFLFWTRGFQALWQSRP